MKIHALKQGLDPEKFEKEQREKAELAAERGKKMRKFVFLAIGIWFVSRKLLK